MPTKSNSVLLKALILISVLLLLVSGILLGKSYLQTRTQMSALLAPTVTHSPTTMINSKPPTSLSSVSKNNQVTDWKTYIDDTLAYSFQYPINYSLKKEDNRLIILSPTAKCNPKLIFNDKEYAEFNEVKIEIQTIDSSLLDVVRQKDRILPYWEQIKFNNHKAYMQELSAEMIAPLMEYLISIDETKTLDLNTYTFASDDLGKCNPQLKSSRAIEIANQILSTFKFMDIQTDDTADWEIFNSGYPFTFQHPSTLTPFMASHPTNGIESAGVYISADMKDSIYVIWDMNQLEKKTVCQGDNETLHLKNEDLQACHTIISSRGSEMWSMRKDNEGTTYNLMVSLSYPKTQYKEEIFKVLKTLEFSFQ